MRIGEVAEITGLSISNIRFYEKKGLIEPDRNQDSKYRDYTGEDVKRLKEIILYRKMDFPIESIHQLLERKVSVQTVLEQQLSELQEKQKMLQGAMDLCEKIIADGCAENLNVENYLYYVKEEEARGKTFAKVDDILTDFAEYTKFDRMAGDPYVGKYLRNPKINRVVTVLWGVMWFAIPVYGMLDMYMNDGRITPAKFMFWSVWMLAVMVSFLQYRKRK